MANAVINRYVDHEDLKSVSEIIIKDGREDKKHSVAYLYIMRMALVNNWRELALVMARRVSFHIGTLLDAIDADYGRIKKTLSSNYREVDKTAYAAVLEYLGHALEGRDKAVLSAFISLKAAIQTDSIPETAAVLS